MGQFGGLDDDSEDECARTRQWRRADDTATQPLLDAIVEFLGFHDFPGALAALQEERACSAGSRKPCGKEGRGKLCADLLRFFDQGRQELFFAVWDQFAPASELEAQKLEFNLHIFFSIYPVLPCSSVLVAMPMHSHASTPGAHAADQQLPGTKAPRRASPLGAGAGGSRQELASRMKQLRTFLETKGAGLASTGAFVVYYALPYVANPDRHPSFEHLFQQEWVSGLRKALKQFAESIPVVSQAPQLYLMYEAYRSAADGGTSPLTLSRQGSPPACPPPPRRPDPPDPPPKLPSAAPSPRPDAPPPPAQPQRRRRTRPGLPPCQRRAPRLDAPP